MCVCTCFNSVCTCICSEGRGSDGWRVEVWHRWEGGWRLLPMHRSELRRASTLLLGVPQGAGWVLKQYLIHLLIATPVTPVLLFIYLLHLSLFIYLLHLSLSTPVTSIYQFFYLVHLYFYSSTCNTCLYSIPTQVYSSLHSTIYIYFLPEFNDSPYVLCCVGVYLSATGEYWLGFLHQYSCLVSVIVLSYTTDICMVFFRSSFPSE